MKVLIHRAFQVGWLVVFSLETYLLLAFEDLLRDPLQALAWYFITAMLSPFVLSVDPPRED